MAVPEIHLQLQVPVCPTDAQLRELVEIVTDQVAETVPDPRVLPDCDADVIRLGIWRSSVAAGASAQTLK